MTLEDVKTYLKKSGDEEIVFDHPLIVNEHGFMSYRLTKKQFVIIQCYGDGKYWDEQAQELAKTYGRDTIVFTTKRNPATFEKRFGYEVIGHVMEKRI